LFCTLCELKMYCVLWCSGRYGNVTRLALLTLPVDIPKSDINDLLTSRQRMLEGVGEYGAVFCAAAPAIESERLVWRETHERDEQTN